MFQEVGQAATEKFFLMNTAGFHPDLTGRENIYLNASMLGLTDEEIRSYFTGPAHLPWHRMQNIDRWGGPLPVSWLENQKELQKQKITFLLI